MPNQQLIEYIKQQVQLGVSRESIKQTLVSSGWPEQDISDAFGTVSPAQSAAPAQPVQQAQPVTSDIFQPKTDQYPTKKDPVAVSASFQAKVDSYSAQDMRPAAASGRSFKSMILPGILILIILGLLGATGYLYMQNGGLTEDIAKKSLANDELSRQVAAVGQEKSNLNGDVTKLNEDLADVTNNLAVLVSSGTAGPVSVTLKGTLRGDDKTPYTFESTKGVVLAIKNYKAANANAALKPALGTGVTITGTTMPGSKEITVLSINGATIPEELAPAPSSTPPAAGAGASTTKPIMP